MRGGSRCAEVVGEASSAAGAPSPSRRRSTDFDHVPLRHAAPLEIVRSHAVLQPDVACGKLNGVLRPSSAATVDASGAFVSGGPGGLVDEAKLPLALINPVLAVDVTPSDPPAPGDLELAGLR